DQHRIGFALTPGRSWMVLRATAPRRGRGCAQVVFVRTNRGFPKPGVEGSIPSGGTDLRRPLRMWTTKSDGSAAAVPTYPRNIEGRMRRSHPGWGPRTI